MSITPPTGILDITNATVRVSKLEFRGSTGFDTILNNVARNTVLLVDQNVEYTSSNSWALKLPNAWVAEFDAYWASGASGNIDFNVYNNLTSGTNGYTISMDDTTITVAYDGGSALATATLGSTLKNDTWRKIHVLFERDMISVALDGVPVLYFKDTLLRPRVYDENSGYVVVSGLSADRKFKNIRVVNGDKWITDGTSNIAYVHGNVGIGTKTPEYTLDVKGDVRATGNLLIEGLTTTVDTQNLSIEDAIVEIGRGNDGGTSGKDVGFLFTRNNGSDTTNSNVALIYDESTDRLTLGYSDGGPTASTLAINTSKSLDVVIPSGNLGIGTDSPQDNLHIYSNESGGTQLKIENANTTGDTRAGLFLQTRSSNVFTLQFTPATEATIFDNKGQGGYAFYQQNSSATTKHVMQIDKDGNVGIGTASPLYPFHIHTDTKPQLFIEGSNNSNATLRSGSGPNYRNTYQEIDFGHYAIVNRGADNYIDFKVTSGEVAPTTRMRINGNGNVGIGTVSPQEKLDVRGDTYIDNNSIFMSGYNEGPTNNTEYSQYVGKRYLGRILAGMEIENIRTNSAGTAITGTGEYGQKLHFRAHDFGLAGGSVTDRAMTIVGNNVGIGTATPYAKLHVYGGSGYFSTSGASPSRTSYFIHNSALYVNTTGTFGAVGIYSTDDILSGNYIASFLGYISSSDERIKKNIVDADDAECLDVLRLLKPKKYEYKDVVKRGEEPVWGFIAQEVANVLPHATQFRQEFIPNIYELANVSQSNVITFTNFNTSNLEANATTIRVMTKEDNEERATIAEVIDDHTIRVEEDLSDWIGSVDETGNVVAGNQLFIYGQEVDDFVFLKKESIWTVATAALQEVDRQLQDTKAQLASVLARLDALENA